MTPEPSWICVLAGGRSRRFGGDKAFADAGGGLPRTVAVSRRFIARSADPRPFAVARAAGAFDAWGLPTITDPTEHAGAGPLAGLLAGLRHREAQAGPGWLLLLACDAVAVDPAVVDRLPEPDGVDASVFREAGPPRRFQPLPGKYHTRMISGLEAALARGERSFQRRLAGVGVVETPAPAGLADAAARGNHADPA
ncbi:molybdenum cofactor guanylyltransferase [Phycisphaera mikurensis]|uniref:Putative molybdopterin-guanine dinucleotide biosynthesis protein A n=1 Tax=Phycisphaera mikurensis (strain NBRC 102666 / KCTC 22515 / FYK2301M01) TaxID=1142394 RepID=I0IG01_PHYMF|nr:molybdenum cofactor guanylyltransferase [Phycisphaera mikurensis]MBB6440425.1 molybdopterin-guanine dinucleotide biosynthesis protein A [Phycisphaera mikurensis]BAM04189.1 putative molybdopterin-guanine dinucleotide biosynthesis protein A [Phycisphaera mikurensis NBRC 102666]